MRRPRMRAARLPRCRRPPRTAPRIVVRRAEADRSWGEPRLCQVGAGKSAAAVVTPSGYGAPRRRDRGPKRRQPRQPHPGTRIIHYRCFLPDLAGFADYRRGGTDGATIDVQRDGQTTNADFQKLAEREGFEPSIRG